MACLHDRPNRDAKPDNGMGGDKISIQREGESPMTGTDALLGRLGNAPPLTRTEV